MVDAGSFSILFSLRETCTHKEFAEFFMKLSILFSLSLCEPLEFDDAPRTLSILFSLRGSGRTDEAIIRELDFQSSFH